MISDREFNAIEAGAKVEVLDIDGVKYVTKPVIDPRQPDPMLQPLTVSGLLGICEYFDAHKGSKAGAIAHVMAYNRVVVITEPSGRFAQRHAHVTAVAEWPEGLKFGHYLDLETFNVQLQSLFADSGDRARVLACVGKVKDVNAAEVNDDGVTQNVTVKAGIAREDRDQAPNPVVLAPFRTFRELAQPESPFVLRLRAGQPPTAALHEADGGAWKLEAVARIKAWLRERLEGVPVIG